VARALIIRPRLILADEPTGNLHSSQGQEVMDAFRALNADDGVTVIQVTHSERWTAYGSRVIELHDGWIEADRRVEAAAETPSGMA
jgi:ABC-type lipoprotein export system ATPase subunit